jgi:hypothetical protein
VPVLSGLTPPDVVVMLERAASTRAVGELRSAPGVRVVSLAARGSSRINRTRVHVLGVSISTIRGFTPMVTASSTALWQSLARGELPVSYAHDRQRRYRLGAT